jgi:hypothetical protein
VDRTRAVLLQSLVTVPTSGLEGQARAYDVNWRLRVLANIAADEYRDRGEVGLGGTPGAPPIAVAPMSDEDAWARFMKMKDEANGYFR